ncbi:MAG: nucleotide sugar dehydrogenase [archaeon]
MSKVCVLGLGYVGLPLASLCSRKGHEVFGVDTDSEKIEKINSINVELSGKVSTSPDKIRGSEIIIICVPTPVNEDKTPDLKPLKSATKTISENLQEGQLVIVESTIFPGTTEEILKPILEESGLKAGTDFFLAHCPERIDPGNEKYNVENLPRVLGAFSKAGEEKARQFYESILDANVTVLSSLKAAEAVKVVENTFRDINIAYVNELAKSFDKAGIDLMEVIKGASTKPFGFMPHYPGCGVGGHCIPVDPYYLIDKARQNGFTHSFLSMARDINRSMPDYTVSLLEEMIGSLESAKVGVLGISYKGNVDDVRGSPGLKIKKILESKGAKVGIYDPFVLAQSTAASVDQLLNESDYVILATPHDEFLTLGADQLKSKSIKAIIDGRNCLDKNSIQNSGVTYKGIGR